MTGPGPTPRTLPWRTANHECASAAAELTLLRTSLLHRLDLYLDDAEERHLTHTVQRINALLFLYATVRRAPHDTRLGVLLGAVTHLLDHAYDRRAASARQLDALEEVVLGTRRPDPDDPWESVLGELAARCWQSVADPAAIRAHLERMITTQRRSQAQTQAPDLPSAALAELTRDKGHHSVCLYFAAVNPAFGAEEERALRSFGSYLQYMDDLEDRLEDRADGRVSLVGPLPAALAEAGHRFAVARRDLTAFYGRGPGHRHRTLLAWLVLFHAGVVVGAVFEHATRALPAPVPGLLRRGRTALATRFPFFEVAPLGATLPSGGPDDH
ncbi:hypothetical protein [Streptacidiphilus jiangxiensis]|uniref:Uncharacterized protein n=1 Tax=Streptacidiphilus jiangxiensis TaxID=235985 RepID=A0A1H7WIY8_STRJI|nr:hypothetical protein [Streptacidiphilus jiangxiensis]SEM21085.1 hypothetical protein SAMN05414137_120173 [Streptacidiphilus jiangxiensis]